MPYVDLQSKDDYASIYYTTSAMFGNVGGLNPELPIIIMLHPLFLDSSWLDNQFGDPRLYGAYNMVAFDMRCSGKSVCRPSPLHDSWVDAADLAMCIQKLRLPPCHILALESISINCALRFAALFPEMCLSITLCNVPSPKEQKWSAAALNELMHNWCFADDLDTLEHTGMESVKLVVGPECDPDIQDELIAYWQTVIPPRQRHRAAETVGLLVNRTPLKQEVYALIKHPVLLIHGERHEHCPRRFAELLASRLVNAQGGVVLYTVKGAYGSLSIIPGSASIANRAFCNFLGAQPHARADLVEFPIPIELRMREALVMLAAIQGDPKIASRDSMSSLSFSCLQPDIIKRQSEMLQRYQRGRLDALPTVGSDGRPIRKYSEKIQEHWFHAGRDGMSTAGTSFLNQ